MPFWKKPVELPEKVYEAVGNCCLASLECGDMTRRFDPITLTPAQACQLLDLVKKGLLELQATIRAYPIGSDQLAAMDLTEDIRTCDTRREAIASLTGLKSGELFSTYAGNVGGMGIVQFVRSIFAMETLLAIHLKKAGVLMAKAANMNLDSFLTRAMDRAKNSPRGRAFLERHNS